MTTLSFTAPRLDQAPTTASTSASTTNPDHLLRLLMADRARWEPQIQFRAEERWFARLPVGDLLGGDHGPVEVWLLTWLPGQRTGLHDHGGSAGAFGVVRGALSEDTVGLRDGRPALRTRVVRDGERRPFGPRHLHDVVNAGTEPAVSVHVYAPGLTRMTRYEWSPEGPVITAVDRAGADW
jgi:hypothetical protein